MSFPRYPAYKPSGVKWLGEVPENWTILPIKHLVGSIEQGWSPQCEAYPAESGQWGVLKVGCVNGGVFNPDENKALPSDLSPVEALSIRAGDILVSRANTRELVGSAAVAHQDYDYLLLCDKLYRLRVRPALCIPLFLAQYLATASARSIIEGAATGASSSMLNIGQPALVNIQIPLPPLSEQQALLHFIVAETAKIDALIAEQQRLIELLQEKRQAVISHSVTKGLNPDAPMKDSGVEWLGEVPEHWTVCSFRRLVRIAEGQVDPRIYPYSEMPLIAPNHILSGTGIVGSLETAAEQGAESGKYICEKGAVIYSKIRPSLRKACIAPEDCLTSADMYPLQAMEGLSPEFLLYFLLSEQFSALAVVESERVAMPKVNRDTLGAVPLAVPPILEQVRICSHIKKLACHIDDLCGQAASSIGLMQERRSALISAAVTGQIDVRGLAPEADAA